MHNNNYDRGGKQLAKAVALAYQDGQTDYTMEPLTLVLEDGSTPGKVEDGDAVVFCCRRGEREIELTDAFTAEDFPHFPRKKINDLDFVILTMYHEKYKDLPIAFAPASVEETLAACVSEAGLSQLHCAESEKFAHITYFFNGGNNQPFPKEDDVRIPSPKGIPFDQKPELSLPEVAQEVKKGLQTGYDFIAVNFANGDVIGHTANSEAKIACAEHVDKHLGEVLEEAKKQNYVVAITADHGNLEVLYSSGGKPHVAHTDSLVPFLLIDPTLPEPLTAEDGILGDIAPTMLQIMNIAQPNSMSGSSLMPEHNFGGRRKLLLIVLDGWGLGAQDDTNPIFLANTPVWDKLTSTPFSKLRASGDAVGLQPSKAGNSEAGHTNIGAGRIIMQDDVRLEKAMSDGSFFHNPVFRNTLRNVKARGRQMHLLALLTKKSSHGSVDYPLALLQMAKEEGLDEVYVHIIFDGRSTEPGSAPALLEEFEAEMERTGIGRIVDGVGRGIALDRDANYAKIKKAYESMVLGIGRSYC
ncbi:alkaline phosphatase family protein [Eubacteriales bacterium OttesenSCG-928-K08]|nr:alkaline phosphatase family protein [Eubacteriales bacterium OttesenSCG-928-K08]